MIVNLGTALIGVLVFLFIFWKRLKEDYASEIIFKSAFYILLGIGVGAVISIKFLPSAFLWLGFLGALGGLGFGVRRLKMRFYESLEALTIGILPWVSFIFLGDSVINSSLNSFIAFLVILVVIFIYYYLDLHYKEFSWYRSGKIGFAGLSTLGIIFVIRSAIALLGVGVISFLSGYEAIASGAAAFICFLLVFNLGRK